MERKAPPKKGYETLKIVNVESASQKITIDGNEYFLNCNFQLPISRTLAHWFDI